MTTTQTQTETSSQYVLMCPHTLRRVLCAGDKITNKTFQEIYELGRPGVHRIAGQTSIRYCLWGPFIGTTYEEVWEEYQDWELWRVSEDASLQDLEGVFYVTGVTQTGNLLELNGFCR
jgi:hypothetical protein